VVVIQIARSGRSSWPEDVMVGGRVNNSLTPDGGRANRGGGERVHGTWWRSRPDNHTPDGGIPHGGRGANPGGVAVGTTSNHIWYERSAGRNPGSYIWKRMLTSAGQNSSNLNLHVEDTASPHCTFSCTYLRRPSRLTVAVWGRTAGRARGRRGPNNQVILIVPLRLLVVLVMSTPVMTTS
jgi:hypothetical protein